MITVTPDAPLRPLNTMGIDGTARALVEWSEPDDLPLLFSDPRYADTLDPVVRHIGEGSNLLFTTPRFDGTLLRSLYRPLSTVCAADDIIILRAGAGLPLDTLVATTADSGLWGLVNLSLIPGTVGAAAVQNVGAYGVEFGDLVRSVTCYDRHARDFITIPAERLGYAYRDSIFKHQPWKDRLIITEVDIALPTGATPRLDYGNLRELAGPDPSPADVRRAVISTRLGKLPEVGVTGSAGSFFKNPVIPPDTLPGLRARVEAAGIDPASMPAFDTPDGIKLSAAWLIDRAGCKGIVSPDGNVGTWPSQPLVIVNLTGRATGPRVVDLADRIVSAVREKFGVTLHPEVEYL